jgi:hypothetical protein
MNRGPLIITISLGLIVGLVSAPTAALAQRPSGGPSSGGRIFSGGQPSGSHPRGFSHPHPHSFNHPHPHGLNHPHSHGFRHHHGFNHHGFHHKHHGFRPFSPWGVVTLYAPPLYYGAPAYYPPPAYYTPGYIPPAVYGAPAGGAPSTPSVIQHPNGRYELRGDGVTTPYTWVWIPNPPQAPPPAAPPAAPPAGPSGSDDPPSPTRYSKLYRWTDEQGVVHWTDRPAGVPPQHRPQATQTPSF